MIDRRKFLIGTAATVAAAALPAALPASVPLDIKFTVTIRPDLLALYERAVDEFMRHEMSIFLYGNPNVDSADFGLLGLAFQGAES